MKVKGQREETEGGEEGRGKESVLARCFGASLRLTLALKVIHPPGIKLIDWFG